MHDRDWWIEGFTNADRGPGAGKLKVLPQLSRGIRHITGWDRAYDFGTNLIALGAPGVEDIVAIPQIAHDCTFNPPSGFSKKQKGDQANTDYATKHKLPLALDIERPCKLPKTDEERKIYTEKRRSWIEGQAQALWPELDLLIRRVKSGDLKC